MEIGEALGFGAREEAAVAAGVRADLGLEAETGELAEGAVEGLGFQAAGGGDRPMVSPGARRGGLTSGSGGAGAAAGWPESEPGEGREHGEGDERVAAVHARGYS